MCFLFYGDVVFFFWEFGGIGGTVGVLGGVGWFLVVSGGVLEEGRVVGVLCFRV